ncbi:MAG: cation diffusion facilitator family transporter [Bacteroidales bacterium]|nr:cation diffusion facilitator family transporter [Bacteroidales bacterium]MDD3101019.1 cation diffusion facilitator family transporter [Bacteroidales bacterium]MDD3639908.1 cation diffusion facilitator family transporter [Bacteroidales bacterium]MDD4481143.1 cation diffusion facilitator family transporter [Bacteroidales bacterium]MDD5714316.1 cation diffusion facilitator family transporter [Bacteroidales bacterium]
MAHEHDHMKRPGVGYSRSFAIGIGLNVVFVAVEVIYGFIANSSALLADAGHNAGDVLGLVFAWAAAWMATMKPKGKYTYGLRKTTILVSILNAMLLFGAVAVIAWDAFRKLKDPQPVAGSQVMIVAGIGIFINAFTALLFYKGQKTDLNIKGAFLHMAADAGVSLGVVIAGLLITLTGKTWIDPAISFLIIVVILWGTWRLFSESLDLALDAVPRHIKIGKVREFLLTKQGVTSIHDLHIWAMSTTQVALTVHLVMPEGATDQFISQLQRELLDTFGIGHSTFQIENKDMSNDFFGF